MIRVTLTNSKLDKELGQKKKTSKEDFLFSRKKLTALLPQKHHYYKHICKCSQKPFRFYPSSYFILILSRTQFSSFTLPLWPVFRLKPHSARGCSKGKTSRSIKRHHCFSITFSLRPAYHMTHRQSQPCSFSIFGTLVATTVTFCEHILFEIFVIPSR